MWWIWLLAIALIGFVVYISMLWGENRVQKKMIKERLEDVAKDAEISTRPNVDDPLNRM